VVLRLLSEADPAQVRRLLPFLEGGGSDVGYLIELTQDVAICDRLLAHLPDAEWLGYLVEDIGHAPLDRLFELGATADEITAVIDRARALGLPMERVPAVFDEHGVDGVRTLLRSGQEELDELLRQASASAGLERRLYRPTVRGSPSLPAGHGRTDKFGDVVYSTSGSATDVELVKYHELVHSFLSPRLDVLRTFRANLRMSAYQNSHLLRYIEEALAETYAQLRVNGLRGLPDGLIFPVANGYVTVSRVIGEAFIGTIVIGSITVGVHLVVSEEPE
jgi:hypothetical protein